jgi:hypothetical protein
MISFDLLCESYYFERIRELLSELNTHKLLFPWRRIRRKSSFGNREHCFNKKPFAFREKTLPFGIPINVRQPFITPNALSQLMK